MTSKDRVPAFPAHGYGPGMSLLDYFAGEAMKQKMNVYADYDAVGIESYKQAASMLKARGLLKSDNENN